MCYRSTILPTISLRHDPLIRISFLTNGIHRDARENEFLVFLARRKGINYIAQLYTFIKYFIELYMRNLRIKYSIIIELFNNFMQIFDHDKLFVYPTSPM